jgi:hypothetical protein
MVRCQILLTTLRIFTHMEHVHITPILIIRLEIVHPIYGQSSNFAYEQMNTSFSSPGFESNSNIYTPDWSNHSDFSWQAHAMGNYAPQFHELHILNIRSLIIYLPFLHHMTIFLNNIR